MTPSSPEPQHVDRQHVETVIADEIRPLLRIHGGDIELIGVTNGDLELEFIGACRACALKSVTYAIGIRERLLHLRGVRSVSVAGINLSEAAIERVARAYSSHPLLKTMIRTGEADVQPHDNGACSCPTP